MQYGALLAVLKGRTTMTFVQWVDLELVVRSLTVDESKR